jgi:tryptophan synthase alpha chain
VSKIAGVFNTPGRKALITYLTVGYPNVETTLEMVPVMVSAGCDLVELGIPFSDPLADGPTIQRSSYNSLRQGTTPEQCLDVAHKLSKVVAVPLVFMTYYNPVHRYGLDTFCRDSAAAGISGLIVPDLTPDEGAELEETALKHGLDLIYLLAPTSDDERIDVVAARSRGFIYLVSLTGVTGARDTLPEELESFVLRVRKRASQPLCVGFGISSPDLARRAASVADGIIVGSRLVQLTEEENAADRVRAFVQTLREALSEERGDSAVN